MAMEEKSYDVVLHTLIGPRYGRLTLTMADETLTGELVILAAHTVIQGVIDDDGNCRFRGELVTLLRVWPFTAQGQVTPQTFTATLDLVSEEFLLEGTVVEKEGA